MRGRLPQIVLIAAFLLSISAVGVVQAILEYREGERPQVADLFVSLPTVMNLRLFEKNLENSSWLCKQSRPLMQYARFVALHDPGQKAILGREGWWFYRPDVRYLIEEPEPQDRPGSGTAPITAAIVSFRDQLAQRGIHLMVVPAPGKPSVYPEMLSSRAGKRDKSHRTHSACVISVLRGAGIEVVDLFEVFADAREAHSGNDSRLIYLARDTHWSGHGVRLAAEVIAKRIRELGWVPPGTIKYDLKPVAVNRRGDVLKMLGNPRIDRLYPLEDAACTRVVRADTGKAYKDDPNAAILVMGDSFLRIYERDEPGSAGLIAHLAYELAQPMASLVGDGGASTLVRQDLARRPDLLAGKKVVVWEFVERDIRFGTNGWEDVRLPEPSSRPASP